MNRKGFDTMTEIKPLNERIDYLEKHFYNESDLGLTYTSDYSLFKVWSPLTKGVWVNLYESAESSPLRLYWNDFDK